jgi:hypothetical protein
MSSPLRLITLLGVSICTVAFIWTEVRAAEIEDCKPIRRPRLLDTQVDQVVLTAISKVAGIPTNAINLDGPLKDADRAGLGMMLLAFVVVNVSDELGVNLMDGETKARRDMYGSDYFARAPVRELQATARRAYFRQSDSAYPSAIPGARYHGVEFEVSTPSPTAGWQIIRCASDEIVFVRHFVDGDELRAAARGISLEPYKSKDRFLSQVRDAVSTYAATKNEEHTVQVEFLDSTPKPCALGIVTTKHGATKESKSDALTTLYARFCYGNRVPHLGYAALFMHSKWGDVEADRRSAEAFFEGVKPFEQVRAKSSK